MSQLPSLIIVSGPAGSGKTTLAHELAASIGCPALCRDELKEGMVHATPGFEASVSDPLTMRTYGLFFETIELWLRAGISHVAEAAFQDHLWRRGLDPLIDLADVRIVRCMVSPEVARERMMQRMAAQASRVAHADVDHLDRQPSFNPIALDRPTLDVDTIDGYQPPLENIVAFAR